MQTPTRRRRAARRRIRDARQTAAMLLEQRKRELRYELEQRSDEVADEERPTIA